MSREARLGFLLMFSIIGIFVLGIFVGEDGKIPLGQGLIYLCFVLICGWLVSKDE